MQIAFLNYKSGYYIKTFNSMQSNADVLTAQYIGAQSGSAKHNKYASNLNFGKSLMIVKKEII